jgi:hypothetical protein
MNKTDLIKFIINKLIKQNKFEDCLLWFETIPDKNMTYHIMDHEYEIFTQTCILEYLQMYVTDNAYEYLDNLSYTNTELLDFLRICIERKMDIVLISNEFYDLFIYEATNYSSKTLK